ncbi:FctA domain-containing protein [Clostridium perfringens]|nr:FctA domain-containing protein [Clostridium perfringens]
MINKKKLSALLLSGAMLMSMSTSVFAQGVPTIGDGTEGHPATATIKKNFEFSEGIATPQVTFKFTATSSTPDAPTATITDISYTDGENAGNVTDGKYTISKNTAISFGEFPHAGLYEYTVKETNEHGTGITYDTNEYKVRVYVANGKDKPYVKTITSENNNEKKPIIFTNTYKKDASLIIEKNTTGELADKTKDFDFTIIFTKSATSDDKIFTGKIGNETVTCEAGVEQTFKLHDKEQLVFNNLPAGTRYVVKEKGIPSDGYTPSVTVIENDVTTVNGIKGNETDDLSSSTNGTNLVGEKTNKVTFVNTHNDTPITGIIINNSPFILMISFAVLGFGALAIIKRRKTIR